MVQVSRRTSLTASAVGVIVGLVAFVIKLNQVMVTTGVHGLGTMRGSTQGSGGADPARRKFLIRTIAAIGVGVTAALGAPAIAFVTGSARTSSSEETWIRLGSVSSFDPGAPPSLMKATVERRSGYLVEEQEISVFVTTGDGVGFTILSNVCTHLGCRVRWVAEQDRFLCPCHNAVFGPDGGVVRGPPPKPLDRYEYKVEEGQLFFKEA